MTEEKPRARHKPEQVDATIQLDGATIAHEIIEPPAPDERLEDLRHEINTLSDQVQMLHTQLLVSNMLVSGLHSDATPVVLLRRRTQDEMLAALRLLVGGQQRPRDDDSPQVLEDAIYEVAALRQAFADLMQAMTGGYQQGLAAIRKMTER